MSQGKDLKVKAEELYRESEVDVRIADGAADKGIVYTIIVASHGDYRDKCAFNRIITMNNGRIKEDVFLKNE